MSFNYYHENLSEFVFLSNLFFTKGQVSSETRERRCEHRFLHSSSLSEPNHGRQNCLLTDPYFCTVQNMLFFVTRNTTYFIVLFHRRHRRNKVTSIRYLTADRRRKKEKRRQKRTKIKTLNIPWSLQTFWFDMSFC